MFRFRPSRTALKPYRWPADPKPMHCEVLTLCDAVTNHPDGPFSMLRGGLDTFTSTKTPIGIGAVLFAVFHIDSSELGEHRFEVQLRKEGEAKVLQELKGVVEWSRGAFQLGATTGKGVLSLPTPMMSMNEAGTYTLTVRLDDSELGMLTINGRVGQ